VLLLRAQAFLRHKRRGIFSFSPRRLHSPVRMAERFILHPGKRRYNPADVDDVDWFMRITRMGESVVEITFTLNEKTRKQHRRFQLVVLAIVAIVVLLVPLPILSRARASMASVSRDAALGWPPAATVASWLPFAVDFGVRLLTLLLLAALYPQPVVQESLVAMRGLGVQLKSVRRNGAASCQFLDANSLKSVVINEGIQMCDVRYYMALVVVGRKSLVLLFDNSRPRLPLLSKAYRQISPVLFPEVCEADVERYLNASTR